MLPPNVIIPYDSTHASIPAKWTRDTRFDSRSPKGATTSLGTTGGATTHTHTGTQHSHSIDNHVHGMQLGTYAEGQSSGTSTAQGRSSDIGHTHWGNDVKYSTATSGGTLTATVAYPSSTHLPSYYSFIFIKATNYNLYPANGIVMTANTSRVGCTFHVNSASKHLMGAATGADAGTTGGAETHTHTLTHSHTAVVHSHTGATLTDSSDAWLTWTSPPEITSAHAHTLYWNNYSLSGSASSVLTTPPGSNLPLTKNINLFKTATALTVKVGDIVMTTETALPIGWILCDGTNSTPNMTNYYVRNNPSAGAATDSGSSTHSHAANSSHGHGTAAHTHTGSTSSFAANCRPDGGGTSATRTHTHYTFGLTSANASWTSANVGASSTDSNEPPFIAVKFIQATSAALGGTASIMSAFL